MGMRAEVWHELGGCSEEFPRSPDTDLVLRAREQGYPVFFWPGASVVHSPRRHRLRALVCYSAAQAGDTIFSTGCLGDSRAGLHLILNSIAADSEELAALVDTHLLPRPYLEEGRFLAHSRKVHAAIDVSDGLSSDLGHIVRESRVGARLYARQIPISPYLQTFCSRFNFDPSDFALAGGEDYTLLCTADRETADDLAEDYRKRFDRPLHPIGEISDSKEIELVEDDGRVRIITPTGWDHFKS